MRKLSTLTSHQKATLKPASVLVKGDLVVIEGKQEKHRKGVSRCVVKLEQASTNSLNWYVWTFKILSGTPANPNTTTLMFNQFDIVEVVLPLIEVEEDTRHKWIRRVEEVSRPWHTYVEVSAGTNTYVVYKFARVELAENVKGCAERFGLKSFIIDTSVNEVAQVFAESEGK